MSNELSLEQKIEAKKLEHKKAGARVDRLYGLYTRAGELEESLWKELEILYEQSLQEFDKRYGTE